MQDEDEGPGSSFGELQRELDRLATTLGHSVSLDGPDGTLLGHSSQGTDVDPVRINAVLTRRVPDDVIAHQRRYGIDSAAGTVRVPASAELGMAARLCLPLRHGRRIIAYLWVLDEAESLDAAAVHAIRASGERIRPLLQPERTPVTASLLAQLFTDRPRPDLLDRLVHRERIPPEHVLQFAVVIATSTDRAGRVPTPATEVPPGLGSRPVIASADHRGQRLVLLGAPRVGGAGDAHLGHLATHGQSGQHVIGHSAPFRVGEDDVSGLAARAVVAAGCAAVDGALPAITGWAHLGPYRRLLLTTSPDSWPEPLPIPDTDRSAAALRRTLETFLDHGGDAAQCIAALGIHRTTYYYRLDRLSSRYGVQLTDGLSRTDLHLALKTHRLQQARDLFGWTTRFLGRVKARRASAAS